MKKVSTRKGWSNIYMPYYELRSGSQPLITQKLPVCMWNWTASDLGKIHCDFFGMQ